MASTYTPLGQQFLTGFINLIKQLLYPQIFNTHLKQTTHILSNLHIMKIRRELYKFHEILLHNLDFFKNLNQILILKITLKYNKFKLEHVFSVVLSL